MADALAATELVLAREQHLSQLDGLAAAAAHELGTPLATIAVVVAGAGARAPAGLAASPRTSSCCASRRSAAANPRQALRSPAEGAPFERMPLSMLIEEVVAPHRNFGIAIDVSAAADATASRSARAPAILYGLGNLVENAVDFARERVEIAVRWSEQEVAVTISTTAGLPAGNPGRIGEPYVTSAPAPAGERGERPRPRLLHRQDAARAHRRDGRVPQPARSRQGAVVRVRWPRADIEVDA